MAWRSISELARSCGTSATSVVRFCRAVGLRGYPELRLALAGAVAHDDAAAVAAASGDIDPGDGFVAMDLQMKLQRIAKPAFAWPDAHMAVTSAALRRAGDVAVGLSHTGTTVDTIDALAEARAHGATTVAVTNFPWSPITEVADHTLLTAARETAFRSGAMTSRIAQLTAFSSCWPSATCRPRWRRWSGRSPRARPSGSAARASPAG